MSKKIDFTQPGGFPLTQDQLDYLQTAWSELFGALGLLGGAASVPLIVSGMTSTSTGPTTTVSAGWFYYNGELVKFPGASFSSAAGVGRALYLVLSKTGTTLTYNNGSTPEVVLETTATITSLVNTTPTDATHVPWANAVMFGTGFGKLNRDAAYTHQVLSTSAGNGTISGDLYYKKDYAANTLIIYGSLSVNTPADFATALPGVNTQTLFTFPVGYRPVNEGLLRVNVAIGNDVVLDAAGGYHTSFSAYVLSTGAFKVDFLKTDGGVSNYNLNFSAVISLD